MGKSSFSVPRRPVNAKCVSVASDDDPIIAENTPAAFRHQKVAQCALACPGVPDEKIAMALGRGQSARMQFHAVAGAEAVHHGEFVERILEGIVGVLTAKKLFVEQDFATSEAAVEDGTADCASGFTRRADLVVNPLGGQLSLRRSWRRATQSAQQSSDRTAWAARSGTGTGNGIDIPRRP